jgi:YgiT-type zinc finger domain-containing protein
MGETQRSPEFPCNECQAGVMRLEYLTYFTWMATELVTVPNFPAWVCDVCGKREYDERAIHWLDALLDPATGQSARKLKPKRPSARGINRLSRLGTSSEQ